MAREEQSKRTSEADQLADFQATEPDIRRPGRQAGPKGSRLRERVGPYRILEELGHGGMGVVYLAEQIEPVRRRIALKMLRSDLGNRELRVRFEAERHAMARLQHPNIAQLYEAGETEYGEPYFAMELVQGVPVTEFCDHQQLRISDRLKLFQVICGGVQHAHEKGLLHRDLKPANILVTDDAENPVPKILDFGIAKAIDQPLIEGTAFTGENLIGTPAYISPEAVEAAGTRFDLDTRSDVYSLGILLYELLVGVRPFETSNVSFLELLNHIASDESSGPRTRWTELDGEIRKRLAKRRGHDEVSLWKRLEGDLDWIVLKAIAKDRRERYSSAADLAADLERHRNHLPVEASPPSALYRMKKFVRRRRGLVIASTLLLLSLLLGFSGTLINLERAQREAVATQKALDETAELSSFLQGLFEVSDPSEARGNSITARELLDRGAVKIQEDFRDQPLAQARFMQTIGTVYMQLGLFEQAEPLLSGALEIRETELDENHLDIAASCQHLGYLYRRQGLYEQAEPLFRRALDIREATLGPDHPEVASSLNGLGVLYRRQGLYEKVEPLYRRALEIREKAFGLGHPEVAASLNNLGILYKNQGRYDEAEVLYQRALEIREAALGPDHPDVAQSFNGLGILYKVQGRYDEAEPLYQRDLEIKEKTLGPNHPEIAKSLISLGNLYSNQGRYSDAEPVYQRALRIHESALGADHPDVAMGLHNLGILYRDKEQFEEAEQHLLQALEIYEVKLDSEHMWVANALLHLAGVYQGQQRHEEAEPLYRRSLAIYEANLPAEHPDLRETLLEVSQFLRMTGRETEARELELRAEPANPKSES